MRELTFLGPRRVEWRSVPEPRLGGPREALVRPVIAGRCDGDNLPIFNRVTTGIRAGVALHHCDPLTLDLLGAYPFKGPFAIGHECIGSVIECGEEVRSVKPGDLVIVPWAVSCGSCARCNDGITSRCLSGGNTVISAYGFGPVMGPWGGTVCDVLRVPFADGMLVPVPDGVDPLRLASASDNLTDAWRSVAPQVAEHPGATVLVTGGGARSNALYCVGLAVALGSTRVTTVTLSRRYVYQPRLTRRSIASLRRYIADHRPAIRRAITVLPVPGNPSNTTNTSFPDGQVRYRP